MLSFDWLSFKNGCSSVLLRDVVEGTFSVVYGQPARCAGRSGCKSSFVLYVEDFVYEIDTTGH